MKRWWFGVCLLGVLLCFRSVPVSAAPLVSVEPQTSTFTAGEEVTVLVLIDGLGDRTAPSLAAFDVDVTFDPAVLAFEGVAFATFLGIPANDESAIASVTLVSPDRVDLALVSTLSDTALAAIQPPGFDLVQVRFRALVTGSSPVGVTVEELVEADLELSIFSDGFESGDTSRWSVTVP